MRNRSISAIGIILLLIGISIIPSISGNIKTIHEVVYEDVTIDRIEDIYGLIYDDGGYFINNPLDRENTNLVSTKNNGPGEINPIWITSEGYGYYREMKAYEDYIYISGHKFISVEEPYLGLLAKFNITDGELVWINTWEGFHFRTNGKGLDIYNDSIYVTGWTGPPPGILWWMDSFICKYDLDGNLLWSKLINETKYDFINGVKCYDNYVYLCGFRDTYEGIEGWILKYDTDGNKIWSKTYRIQDSITNFNDFEIYNGYIYAEEQTDTYDENAQDVLVVKISLDGELIWFREWGGKGPQLGTGIDIEGGYIYVCGYGRSAYGIESPSYGILLKYDTEGKLQWDSTTSTKSSLVDIKVFNGSVYTTGEIWRNYPYGPYGDVVLQKYDTDGELIWYLTYGENDIDKGRCIETHNNSFYLCGRSGDMDFILNNDVDLFSDNIKPDTPSKPSGQVNGIPGVEYDYSTSTTDPDGDLLSYCFSWGEENVTLTNWINSGDTVSASYSWSERGKYNVRVRARDECGFVSDWSEPLEVTMPRNRAAYNSLFLRFLEQFPNLFPILRLLLQR